MTIVFFSHNSALEGAPLHILALCKQSIAYGYDVLLVVPEKGPLSYLAEKDGIRVMVTPHLALPDEAERVVRQLRRESPDIFFVNTIVLRHLLAPCKRFCPNAQLVWMIHESNPQMYFESCSDLMPSHFQLPDMHVFSSRSTRSIYHRLVPSSSPVIYDCVETASLKAHLKGASKEHLRTQYRLPTDATFLCQIGTIIPRKGCLESLTVAMRVAEERPEKNIHLLLVGNANTAYQKEIIALAKQQQWADRLWIFPANFAVHDFFAMADVFLFPTYTESCPHVLLEAMAHGLPIACSRVHGCAEVVQHGISGLLTLPGNVRELSKAVLSLIDYPEDAAKMGKRAKKVIRKRHSPQYMFEQYEEKVFTPLLKRKKRKKPKVDIIIPCHNYGAYLKEAVESALYQTHASARIMIVDDASTDETKMVGTRLAAQHEHVEYLYGEWHDVSAARNHAAAASHAPFMVFLDADDFLPPNYIERCLEVMDDPGVALAYGDWQWFGTINRFDRSPAFNKTMLEEQNYISSHALIRRSAFEQAGSYTPHTPQEDWDLYKRIIDNGWKAKKARTFFWKRQHDRNREDQYQHSIRKISKEIPTCEKLHLGAGENVLPGWLNTDREPVHDAVMQLDTTQPFPFCSDVFSHIFSEHHIEHMTYAEGLQMLSECNRCLKPGGVIRIATPNLESYLSVLKKHKNPEQQDFFDFAVQLCGMNKNDHSLKEQVLNCLLYNWGHQFIYTPAILENSLRKAGFEHIKQCAITELESHGSFLMHEGFLNGESMNHFETFVLEARKEVGAQKALSTVLVVIPTSGKDIPRLNKCIECLYKASDDVRIRPVIIVSPNGTKRVHAIREQLQYPATVLGLDGAFNYVRSINEGISLHQDESFILLLNDDCFFREPQSLKRLITTLRKQEWACIGPWIHQQRGTYEELKERRCNGVIEPKTPITGACALWDATWMQRIGTFDEQFGEGYGFEEADFALRAMKLGVGWGRDDRVVVDHINHATFGPDIFHSDLYKENVLRWRSKYPRHNNWYVR